MKKLAIFLLTGISSICFGQYTSPGTGITFNLNTLSQAAPSVLVKTGNTYQMTANITISATDQLLMDENAVLKIDGGMQLTIFGAYDTTATNLVITATDPSLIYKGIRFEGVSSAVFKNTILEYGGGIQVLTPNFLMENCTVRYFKAGLVTGAAVNFSTGNPVVKNSTFIDNDLPAVASGATNSVALEFTNNYLSGNTKANSNRPQINMGPSGSAGTTKVLNNIVIGNRALTKVGGISVSSLTGGTNNVQIEGNTVTDNRYGITVAGNASSGSISNNILTNNNSENAPMTGGSGISINGSGAVGAGFKIEKNQIRGNLWGITIIGTATADLGGGSWNSAGENVFYNNANEGKVYALYNNTPNPIIAKNNCWREGELSTPEMVEDVISHSVDDASLGTVTFTPFLCNAPLSSFETTTAKNTIYPNPNNGNFTVVSLAEGSFSITDLTGKLLHSGNLLKGNNKISAPLTPGIYLIKTQQNGKMQSEKIVVR